MLEAERRADRKCCLRIAVACSPARQALLRRGSPGRRMKPSMSIYSICKASRPGAIVVVAAGLLVTAGCTSSSSSSPSASATASASASAAGNTLSVKQIVLAATLKHTYRPDGKGSATTESLSQPDDIVTLGGNLYVGFQNGVGSQGEVSTSGNLDSTLAEFTRTGSAVKQWDVAGKIDGLGADTATGQVIVTVNEDAKSSLYTESGGTLDHYAYTPSLPHRGGTDAVAVETREDPDQRVRAGYDRQGAGVGPGRTRGNAECRVHGAAVAPFFADNATATGVDAPKAGQRSPSRSRTRTRTGSSRRARRVRRGLHAELPGRRGTDLLRCQWPGLQVLKSLTRSTTSPGRPRPRVRCTRPIPVPTRSMPSRAVNAGDRVHRGDPVQRQQRAGHLPWPRLPGQLPGHDQPEDWHGRQRHRHRPGCTQGHDLRPVNRHDPTGAAPAHWRPPRPIR